MGTRAPSRRHLSSSVLSAFRRSAGVCARFAMLALGVAALAAPSTASAEAQRDRFSAGGYFRVMTRPDFEGGNGRLGHWNLYGRLLNEGPWAALELRLDVLQNTPGRNEPWAAVQAKIEGGSIGNADPLGGGLGNFRLTQLYVKAGNILFDRVTWQVGTVETYFGDLGLYDFKPAQILEQMVGLSARYEHERFDALVGVGDSGYGIRGANYNTVLTAGAQARVRILPGHLELGAGGQYGFERAVPGNRFAPYVTPNVRYEDYYRREVVESFLRENPGQENFFPRPEPVGADSWKVIGYLGFGGVGPLRWNNFFINYLRRHPESSYVERFNGRDYTIYTTALTDERYEINAGNEMQVRLIPDRLDAVWGVVYGRHINLDNTIAAGEDNREFYSTVLRLQLYLTATTHFLVENAVAREISLNGNLWREHVNSVFRNTDGLADTRGFEIGDTDNRYTWQLKTGFVLNPTGLGIYTRPSLRLLYGLQYSNQQAAYGSGFVESLDQFNEFPTGPERHWHHLVAIEAEGWF